MIDLDALLEQAIAEGDLLAGIDPAIVASRSPGVQVRAGLEAGAAGKSPVWSAAEDEFVRQNYLRYTPEQMAAALGRSPYAVKIRRYRELGLAGASRNRGAVISATQAARALGVDGHLIIRLFDDGRLPGWIYSEREMRLMRRVTVYRWAVNPENWPYILASVRDTRRIADRHLRRLIERQKTRWADEWLTTAEVADYYGVEHNDVRRAIDQGRIRAVRWYNWHIKRSEALVEGLWFPRGRGAYQGHDWSEEADVFMVIGRALGVRQTTLARLMGWPDDWRRVSSRCKVMRQRGIIRDLIDKHGLLVEYDEASGRLSASWDDYGYMFPRGI